MRVIAFRVAVLAWGLGLLSGVVGSVPMLVLALALCVVSLGAFVAAVASAASAASGSAQ